MHVHTSVRIWAAAGASSSEVPLHQERSSASFPKTLSNPAPVRHPRILAVFISSAMKSSGSWVRSAHTLQRICCTAWMSKARPTQDGTCSVVASLMSCASMAATLDACTEPSKYSTLPAIACINVLQRPFSVARSIAPKTLLVGCEMRWMVVRRSRVRTKVEEANRFESIAVARSDRPVTEVWEAFGHLKALRSTSERISSGIGVAAHGPEGSAACRESMHSSTGLLLGARSAPGQGCSKLASRAACRLLLHLHPLQSGSNHITKGSRHIKCFHCSCSSKLPHLHMCCMQGRAARDADALNRIFPMSSTHAVADTVL
jgi:hypothetical protein